MQYKVVSQVSQSNGNVALFLEPVCCPPATEDYVGKTVSIMNSAMREVSGGVTTAINK